VSTIWNLEATLADGRVITVQADQRDLAAFECEPYGVSFMAYAQRPMTFIRYLAWHAGKRDQAHDIATYERWGDLCVSVTDLDEEAEAPEADPGNPAASAGT